MIASLKSKLLNAAQLAQAGEWDAAHKIVQDYNDAIACWIHAVLHKIEGDEGNSRYWYVRCDANYEDFLNPEIELQKILALLSE